MGTVHGTSETTCSHPCASKCSSSRASIHHRLGLDGRLQNPELVHLRQERNEPRRRRPGVGFIHGGFRHTRISTKPVQKCQTIRGSFRAQVQVSQIHTLEEWNAVRRPSSLARFDVTVDPRFKMTARCNAPAAFSAVRGIVSSAV